MGYLVQFFSKSDIGSGRKLSQLDIKVSAKSQGQVVSVVQISAVFTVNIYPVTKKLSDVKVKRQGYKQALFGGG